MKNEFEMISFNIKMTFVEKRLKRYLEERKFCFSAANFIC